MGGFENINQNLLHVASVFDKGKKKNSLDIVNSHYFFYVFIIEKKYIK